MDRLHRLLDDKPRDQRALIDHDGTEVSFGELAALSAGLAERLAAHGLRGGDRLILIAENCVTYAAVVLAASRLDAWVTLVNARMTPAEVDKISAHADARFLVFTTDVSKAAAAHAERLGAREIGTASCGALVATEARACAPEPVSADPAEQVATLLYTTGTTGAPKGVMLTHANLIFNAEASARLRRLGPEDHVLGVLPGTHIFAFGSVLLACLSSGATLELVPRFSAEGVLDRLARGVTTLPAVPQMYERIIRHLTETGAAPVAPRLRFIGAGGSPLDPAWKAEIERVFGLTLNNGYGMTEAAPGISATRIDRPRTDVSVGQPVEGVEVVVDTPGADGVGEILVRGPNVMKGYYKNPDATRATLRADGFLRTGDLGRFGPDGALHVVGRAKELIIRGGFNVYPPEIEAALTDHPAVNLAAVVGRRASGDEQVLAFCVTNGHVTEDALRVWLRERLAAYKVPNHVLLVDDMPVAATGKILKTRLVDHFKDALAARDAPASAA